MAFLAPDLARQVAVCRAGAIPFFDYVYRAEAWKTCLPNGNEKAHREWRTYKRSDHIPIWVALAVDFSDDYLARRIASSASAGASPMT